jgi:hypothetical protein
MLERFVARAALRVGARATGVLKRRRWASVHGRGLIDRNGYDRNSASQRRCR